MKQKALVVALMAAAMVCTAAASAPRTEDSSPDYSVYELPSLGGTNSIGNSINTFGLIAGASDLSGNQVTHATAWWFGLKYDLGTLGGASSAVEWPVKNDFGVISGISETNKPQQLGENWSCVFAGFIPADGHTCLGFVWEFGRMYPLQPLPGGYNSFATGTNNRFQTVGWAETGFHDPNCDTKDSSQVLQFLPVVWGPNPNQVQALPLEAGDDSGAATAINDRGEIVGISGTCDQAAGRYTAKHMVLWKNGKALDLGNIGGNSWNTPMAINRKGDVVGFAGVAPGPFPVFHAFFWSHAGGPPVDLGALIGPAGNSEALGINDRDQVVGLSCDASFGNCHGFIWQNGVMTDLNKLVPGYNGVIEDAQDINDLGQITGQAQAANGNQVAFWAIPVPDYGDHHVVTKPMTNAVLSSEQRKALARHLGLAGVLQKDRQH